MILSYSTYSMLRNDSKDRQRLLLYAQISSTRRTEPIYGFGRGGRTTKLGEETMIAIKLGAVSEQLGWAS